LVIYLTENPLRAHWLEFILRARFIPGSGRFQYNPSRENRPGIQEFQKVMRAKSLLWTAILIATASLTGACTTKKETPPPPKPAEEFTGSSEAAPAPVETPVQGLETIYFDFDQSVIRDDQKATLTSNANAVKAMKLAKVTVEGHCDERGSDEYNLALGERRANAVKQYLVDSGVTAQIDTVSYGESRPAVQGNDESAWKMNRRAEFVK
jgi:peptidoglycan-associated lipoprotein